MPLSNVVMLPYKNHSQSAKELSAALSTTLGGKVRRLFTERPSKFVPKAKHIVINWGNSHPYRYGPAKPVNHYENVAVASNKLLTFQALSLNPAINIPEWTTDIEVAKGWINEGSIAVCRRNLTGHSGAGIVVADSIDSIVVAPLYTRYIKKKKEFRVHVAFDKVIDIQQKKKRSDFEGDPDPLVRNHSNGWVYCREGVVAPDDLENQSRLAISQLGLDFGAVDVIYNTHHNKCWVLEVNTAPGLEGTTVEKYKKAFTEFVNNGR